MTTNHPELKACPFCKSSDIDPEGVMAQRKDGSTFNYPACNNCGASCETWNTHADLVTRPATVQEITPANKAAIERYIKGCGTPPTASDDVVVEPVTDDYNERLHKAVMRFGAEFRSMEECREFEKDIIRIFAREPVTDAALREAVTEGEKSILSMEEDCGKNWLAKNLNFPVKQYSGLTYGGLKTLITHAIKGQSK